MAHATCTSSGEAGGCAFAESFSIAFAAACAEAASLAIASIDNRDCPCVDAETVAQAYAEETARIFSSVEQVRSNPASLSLLASFSCNDEI